jgi:hypothetical protein
VEEAEMLYTFPAVLQAWFNTHGTEDTSGDLSQLCILPSSGELTDSQAGLLNFHLVEGQARNRLKAG